MEIMSFSGVYTESMTLQGAFQCFWILIRVAQTHGNGVSDSILDTAMGPSDFDISILTNPLEDGNIQAIFNIQLCSNT